MFRRSIIAALKTLGSMLFASVVAADDIDRDEQVEFFPTYALLDPAAERTTFYVHGWIYEPERDSPWRRELLRRLCDLLELDPDERSTKLFLDRAAKFLVDNERNQTVDVRLGGRVVSLAPSQENGHLRSLVTLPTAEVRKLQTAEGGGVPTLRYRAGGSARDLRTFPGRVHLSEPRGLSIVSDVDDTIKDSNVLDKRELIRNTFLREYRAVAGMADVYRRWEASGAAFHYVSASPWQLFADLEAFRVAAKFPAGSMSLRHFRLQDGTAAALVGPSEEYKRTTIETLMQTFPERRFVFVGDSGERDPEVYGELARRRPTQAALIAIRMITDDAPDGSRLRAAFRDVDPARIVLFREAAELSRRALPATADERP